MKKLLYTSVAVVILLGCQPFSGPLPGGVGTPATYVQHVPSQGEFTYSLDLSEGRDVYFAFTNPLDTNAIQIPQVSSPAADAVSPKTGPASPAFSRIRPTPRAVTDFNKNPFSGRLAPQRYVTRSAAGHPIPSAPLLDAIGQTNNGVSTTSGEWEVGTDSSALIPATCRAVSTAPVAIEGADTRVLNIWVANDCWQGAGVKAYEITPAMVTALEDQFLKGGLFNDIYDWVSDMVGSEWGDYTSDPSVIPFNKNITILLCDIDGDDSSNGGVVGFFWGKDNFKDGYVYDGNPASPNYFPFHSNERIMFVVDAVMFANPNYGGETSNPPWTADCYWAEEIYSTLAHEFQHMINFHQKIFVQNNGEGCDTWINEMCSQAVEDLVSDKLGVLGPRGVVGTDPTAGSAGNVEGRIPIFNADPDVSLSNWGGSGDVLESYSVTYAFGAYLLRNYGGAALMRAMVQDPAFDMTQIVNAVSAATGHAETFSMILQRWSAAVLLSNRTDAPPGYVYNTGGFFSSSVGSNTYRLGSIDFFNYLQDGGTASGPVVFTGTGRVGSAPPRAASGTLYLASDNADGIINWLINLPEGVTLTVIVK